jgi:hypothetical protein
VKKRALVAHDGGVAVGQMLERAGEELLAEEDAEDREVEVGIAEADVAPIQHADEPPVRVVQHVVGLEVGVQQRSRRTRHADRLSPPSG